MPENGSAYPTADDDGGFFVQKVKAYYAAGAMSLVGGTPAPTATPTGTPCAIRSADINGDGTVNGLDLAILKRWFMQTVPPAPATVDANGDLLVNGLDLAVMARWFLHNVSAC